MNKIIIIAGPTAVGKTQVSIELAKINSSEIISADSMQIYKEFDIGSAKISEFEMQGIKHHLIDFLEPDAKYSVADYCKDARAIIDELHSQGKVPIIVGGTGLYIHSLLFDMDFNKAMPDLEYRSELELYLQENGVEALHMLLKQQNPEIADKIHPNNSKKIIRTLEIINQNKDYNQFSVIQKRSKYDANLIVLNMDRAVLYDRINYRVDIMIRLGLVDEVKKLKDSGLDLSNQAMQGIGYKELFQYFTGEVNFDEAIENIKQNSRNYAKRQLTWFRKYDFAHFIQADELSLGDIIEYVNNL